jgi:hypothetical protein
MRGLEERGWKREGDERRYRMAAILSTQGMVASIFCSPSQKMLNEDERSGSPNDELTLSPIFGVPAGVPMVVPPWLSDTRALKQREFLASQLRKAAT